MPQPARTLVSSDRPACGFPGILPRSALAVAASAALMAGAYWLEHGREAEPAHASSSQDAPDRIRAIQQRLREYGYYLGPADGQTSTSLTYAIKSFNLDTVRSIDGQADDAFYRRLLGGSVHPSCEHAKDAIRCGRAPFR